MNQQDKTYTQALDELCNRLDKEMQNADTLYRKIKHEGIELWESVTVSDSVQKGHKIDDYISAEKLD